MRTHFLVVLTAVSMFVGVGLVSDSEARSQPKQMFLDTIQDEGQNFVLKGTARKWAFLMKIFNSGIYLDEKSPPKDVMTDVAKRIEVYYYYPIPGKKLAQYTKSQMQLNLTKAERAEVKERMKTLDKYFVDLKPGDRYALSYIPGKGTKFIYNGKEMGIVEGSDFAKGLFAVWVGDKPMDRRLKNQLLGITTAEDRRGGLFKEPNMGVMNKQ